MASQGVSGQGEVVSASRPGNVAGGVSRRINAVIVSMLLIVLVPATMMSFEISTLELTVKNLENMEATGGIRLYDVSDGYQYFSLDPGEEFTYSFTVRPGMHEVYVHFTFQENWSSHYGNSMFRTYAIWPFESEDDLFKLQRW